MGSPAVYCGEDVTSACGVVVISRRSRTAAGLADRVVRVVVFRPCAPGVAVQKFDHYVPALEIESASALLRRYCSRDTEKRSISCVAQRRTSTPQRAPVVPPRIRASNTPSNSVFAPETLNRIGNAIVNRKLRGSYLVFFIGQITERNILPQAADHLLQLEGVSTTAVYGIVADRIHLNTRTSNSSLQRRSSR